LLAWIRHELTYYINCIAKSSQMQTIAYISDLTALAYATRDISSSSSYEYGQ